MFSSSSNSKPADDRSGNTTTEAFAGCVLQTRQVDPIKPTTVPQDHYVSASTQTAAHRRSDNPNWKHRDMVRDEVRNGTESKSGDGRTARAQWPPAAKTGLSPCAGHSAGTTVQLVLQERSSAPGVVNSPAVTLPSVNNNSGRATKGPTEGDSNGSVSTHPRSVFPSSGSRDKTALHPQSAELQELSPNRDDGDRDRNQKITIIVSEADSSELSAGESQRNFDARATAECPNDSNDKEVSSSKSSVDSKDDLRVPAAERKENLSAPNSLLSIPSSSVSSQLRRLETRRGSLVTFILPAHVSSGDKAPQASSRRHSISAEEGALLQEKYPALYSRRMSAPELPSISDRERLRPSSRSTTRSSLSQITANLSGKNCPMRPLSGHKVIPRNDRNSSHKGFIARSQDPTTQSSGSVSSSGGGGGGGMGGGRVGEGEGCDVNEFGRTERCFTPGHKSSSQALSWCATDNSSRLETLFEQKHSQTHHCSNNSLTVPGVSQARRNSHPSEDTLPPRRGSLNGIRPSEGQELARHKSRKKGLRSQCGTREMETTGTIEQFSRLKSNGMRRSVSDNKLADRRNVRNARVPTSRRISVARMEKLTQRKPSRVPGAANAAAATTTTTNAMRRVGFIPHVTERHKTRLNSNQDSNTLEGDSEDSEEEEERRERIREWLMGLDCADTPPPEPVIDYADDPPQTDTAIHIVYQDD